MSTHPTRTLEQIKISLHNILSSHVANSSKLVDWLDSLVKDTPGRLLCINLCIDLENGYLDPLVVADVIDKIAFSGNEARWAFYQFTEDHKNGAFFKHLSGPQLLADDQYVRILPLMDMIGYYLRKPLGLPETYEAEQQVMELFFELEEDERETLEVVAEVWSGKLPMVWVSDQQLSGPPQSSVDDIADRLGLYGIQPGKLVAIVYPDNFDRARGFVPTTLDASFGSLFYLSLTPAGSWGQTCSLTPAHNGVKERVHEAFAGGLTADFEMLFLGEIKTNPTHNLGHLMTEAFKRAR